MYLGGERVDNKLKDGDTDKDEDGIECLHLVWLDGYSAQLPIHSHSLQCPARALGGRVERERERERERESYV